MNTHPQIPPSADAPSRGSKSTRHTVRAIVLSAVLLASGFIGYRVISFSRYVKEHPGQTAPGMRELLDATKTIAGSSRGVAHGNSQDAQSLANKLSGDLRTIRLTLFEGGNPNSAILTKGDFLVFCELNEGSCAFLIHVPELRHYTASAQRSIAELAYLAAYRILEGAGNSALRRVAVATRGAIFFDTVLIGDYTPGDDNLLARITKAEHYGTTVPALYPFFAQQSAIDTD